jgi:CubicO group peptidase (beta-lactamase class C family)
MLKKISLFSIIAIPLIFSFGYSSSKEMNFAKADAIINNDVVNGFGGAVLLVIDGDKIVKQSAYGYQAMFKPDCETSADYSIPKNCYLADKDRTLMNTDTIFDLASLTKVYSTVMAMMHLSYISKLDINKPVAFYIKDYPYKDITVKQVAEHTAGFAPEVNFYNKNAVMTNGKTVAENGFYSQDRATTIDFITGRNDSGNNPKHLITPRVYKPGTENVYSDTDFMLLGIIVENIVGMPQNEYVESEIYKPLGISLKYHPEGMKVQPKNIAQTAVGNWSVDADNKKSPYDNMRVNPIQGHSHDEKLFYSMGGVSGHAGLFGSAKDLAVLVKLLLNNGSYNGVTLFDKATLDKYIAPEAHNDTYATGWRRAGSKGTMAWMMGEYASSNTYGHTGFTGMDTVIDPDNKFGVILLTNRLQSQQLSKPKFASAKYQTPNYGAVMDAVEEEILKTRVTD